MAASMSVGELLAGWRRRRRLSQLELACEAEISQRHLSFVESGRSMPSREMLLHLAEHLRVPIRERNALLVAGGYAPSYREQRIDTPEWTAARSAVQTILDAHRPHPALAVDRHWNLQLANEAALALLAGINSCMLQDPVNVLRISLHPNGLAPRIINYRDWRTHILHRLAQQIELSGDWVLEALRKEIASFPVPATAEPQHTRQSGVHPIAMPLRLASPKGTLSFISTTTIFGTALDITLSELAIETFLPADAITGELMREGSLSAE